MGELPEGRVEWEGSDELPEGRIKWDDGRIATDGGINVERPTEVMQEGKTEEPTRPKEPEREPSIESTENTGGEPDGVERLRKWCESNGGNFTDSQKTDRLEDKTPESWSTKRCEIKGSSFTVSYSDDGEGVGIDFDNEGEYQAIMTRSGKTLEDVLVSKKSVEGVIGFAKDKEIKLGGIKGKGYHGLEKLFRPKNHAVNFTKY